jgi:hypothetical protein
MFHFLQAWEHLELWPRKSLGCWIHERFTPVCVLISLLMINPSTIWGIVEHLLKMSFCRWWVKAECLSISLCSIVIGYDEGTIMVKIGREEPVASMDNSGKIIWAKHNEIQTVNIKSVGADFEVWVPVRPPHNCYLTYNLNVKKVLLLGITSPFCYLCFRSLMVKDCLWLLRSWEHVIFTPKWVCNFFGHSMIFYVSFCPSPAPKVPSY